MPDKESSTSLVDLSEHVSLKEAEALGYGAYHTLLGWVRTGKLPAVRVGKGIRVHPRDLAALVVPVTPGVDPVDRIIDQLVAEAPPLTGRQADRLRDLLGGAVA